MLLKWWTHLKKLFLKKVYRQLVIKIHVMDKTQLYHYERYPTFANVQIPTNKGVFRFVFKEDRRKRVREETAGTFGLSSYFVELLSPSDLNVTVNPLQDKVIVVVKVGMRNVNYEALGELLLDLYVDQF